MKTGIVWVDPSVGLAAGSALAGFAVITFVIIVLQTDFLHDFTVMVFENDFIAFLVNRTSLLLVFMCRRLF